tara:strand:- start:220 stop:561 length:342 start_codon:yes stop_codon:yes gene_type:complete
MSESKFIRHDCCDNCDSSDALAVYTDHSYCFACSTYTKGEGKEKKKDARPYFVPPMTIPVFKKWEEETYRGIPRRILEQYGIKRTEAGVVFEYRNKEGKIIAHKTRTITDEQE